tara:strand:- start:267 stop:494 length:228 start_codon:yes stop_codon:yes gene_type:complete
MNVLTVGKNFGDFKNKTEILDHYKSNKDFRNLNPLVNGAYVNKKDAKKCKVSNLNVRYKNLTKIAVIDVSKDKFV